MGICLFKVWTKALDAGFSFLIFKTFKMKKEYFKIAKKIGVEIIEYKSYMSDLGCRVIYITVSYSKYKFSGDFGYWQNEKSFALSYFKKRLETFKMKIDLKK